VITGGGTGGHLAVARSFKEELNKRGIKPVFIGSSNGQDEAWFGEDAGFEAKYFFDTRGVVNKGKIGKIVSLLRIIQYAWKCRMIFKRHAIKKVISVGGYSAAAASFGALFFRKQLFIHEQNAHIGSLNRLLKGYATAFFSSYLEESSIKDYPIKSVFFDTARVRQEVHTVIFLGGSQGAQTINAFAMSVARELWDRGIHIVHQTGRMEYNKIKTFYTKNSIKCDVFDFSKELDRKIASADFAVSRSGASTLWELSANGVPTLFVPYPYAAGDHQYYNAQFLHEQKLCFLLREEALDREKFFAYLDSDLESMSQNLIETIHKDGAHKIIDFVLKA
jgi:UDP-N-acetylglucosamine--N-acetylmuramyl-(pentapeptide) pyrophosphoryl-undecaprenol N-acetylglucosamine transferase